MQSGSRRPTLAEKRRSLTIFTLVFAATLFLGTIPLIVADVKLRAPRADYGYSVIYVEETHNSILAQLELNGDGPALYGRDIRLLDLIVEYQTDHRLHVLIQDVEGNRYQVPESLFPRPKTSPDVSKEDHLLSFNYTSSPFSFQVSRSSTGEVLFNASADDFVFESQYLRLKTLLPHDPNLYGLGEHFDSFRMPNNGYKRTFWGRDGGVWYDQNLYGTHPVYFEHRTSGTHGVFLLNSNGMDISLDSKNGQSSLEYNVIGGVLDLYFLAGPSPIELSRQYAQVVGRPAMVPYWTLGFHQCKSGYRDWIQVAEVIANYSAARIPLETMWTDIDHYDHRRTFTLDQERFPITRMREIVDHLHRHQQQYVVIVDPAVAHVDTDYPSFSRGKEMDVFLKDPHAEGEYFRGVVWPGVSVFPDFLHPNATEYWAGEFKKFFNPSTGIDIDGVWIDMNEPASFCRYPCEDPEDAARRRGVPPRPPPLRDPPRLIPGFNVSDKDINNTASDDGWSSDTVESSNPSDDQRPLGRRSRQRIQAASDDRPLPTEQRGAHTSSRQGEDDVINPPYSIRNTAGKLSDLTVHTDVRHHNGLLQYDTHNMYGHMMGMATREAMLRRRPKSKPFVLSRSTFAGSGQYVQKWLGDNAARWSHYRSSIAGLLGFASIFQIPMVGSDVCGFNEHPSENLCARWATLGAFSPFYRNHATSRSPPQEFFLWPRVTSAARWAIQVRYRLLDYIYTALQRQSEDGTPAINPLWYLYPRDENTYGIDLQYFYGDCILVSPVTDEDATNVDIYLPDDIFYDLATFRPVRGRGAWVAIEDVPFDRIPLHLRGGCTLPLRVQSANTTAELRRKGFEIMIAPGLDGRASGTLYVDDGVTDGGGDDRVGVVFDFDGAELRLQAMSGFGILNEGELETQMEKVGIRIEGVTVLGVEGDAGVLEPLSRGIWGRQQGGSAEQFHA